MCEQTEEIVNETRATSQEKRPFNIESYLDEFSRALANDVRQLLDEVSAVAQGRMEAKTEPAALQGEKLEGSTRGNQHKLEDMG
ncbi:hypothetical protein PHLGIDRAFT_118602 [Phlebiopsis gigantea 11061_1 CR5-6]|uniref:Uncharacterized protein n=1 Tax=Phlebiopsis gigantea (strain 11061_1 CR5-6) TaxID=745531 RepID=A0A0C3SA95_PHLG1|nr:hypothetical protein PHLGIDRAFT_118602 [Phlebiopsis gigantea 11061_1 CR5-6]